MSKKKTSKAIKRMERSRGKDESQQEEARRAILAKADRVNNTNYGPPEVIYDDIELDPEDIKKQTCGFCGNRFPHELATVSNVRICASPSCRTQIKNFDQSKPMERIHNE